MANWTQYQQLKARYATGARYDSYTNTTQPLTLLGGARYVYRFTDRQRRKKPLVLLPRYGTQNSYQIFDYETDTVGRYRQKTYGSHYSDQEKVLSQMVSVDYETATTLALISEQDLQNIGYNRIREAVISQKSQLAVDLLELSKTKSMLADYGREALSVLRSIRGGRPLADFVRYMNRNGFNGTLGNQWLRYIYGVAPTIGGAYETAEVLNEDFMVGKIYTGKIRRYKEVKHRSQKSYRNIEGRCTGTVKGYFQYTVSDTTLKKFSDLGFTNPLSIAWELMPWSFVLDWFVDVGGYINRMDAALGVTDLWGQVSTRRVAVNSYAIDSTASEWLLPGYPRTSGTSTLIDCIRHSPTSNIPNTFRGIKKFTNEKVRLTSALALISQQLSNFGKVR